MRLLKCHIENFGKLSDQTIDFSENLCIMNQENGWGKSTLAVFIKVMFYGFANENKRSGSIAERERLHYQPWQGGIYGGQLEFEAHGKQYEINRIFGKKEKDDQFHLTDCKTNLESSDYSTKIGEELFQINQESFLKTIFIPQDACESSSTDSINAKLGNLQDSLDDINRHNSVQEMLKNKINELSPRRATGQLKRLGQEIANDKVSLQAKDILETTIQKLEDANENLWKECQNYSKELSDSRTHFLEAGKQRELATKKSVYQDKVKELKQQVMRYEEGRAYFGTVIPSEEQISAATACYDRILVAREKQKNAALLDAERAEYKVLTEYFDNGVPSEEEIESATTLTKRLAQLDITIAKETASAEEQKELQQLRRKFDENPPDEIDTLIEKCDLRRELKAGLVQRQSALVSLRRLENQQEQLQKQQWENQKKQEEENRKQSVLKRQMMFLIPGGILFLVGMVCLIWSAFLAMAMMALATIVVALAFILKNKIEKDTSIPVNTLARQDKRPENMEIEKLENEIRMDEENIREIEVLLREFFEDYELTYSEAKAMDILYRLKGEWKRYQQLCKEDAIYAQQGYEESRKSLKDQLHVLLDSYYPDAILEQENYQQLCIELEKQKQKYLLWNKRVEKEENAKKEEKKALEEFAVFLRTIGKKEDASLEYSEAGMRALLEEIRTKKTALQHFEEELNRTKEDVKEFEQKNDIQCLMQMTEENADSNPAQLSMRIEELEHKLEEKENIRKSYNNQLSEALEKMDGLEELETALKRKEEQYQKLQHHFDVLEKTSVYLEKAKEQFLARYMSPVKGAFDEYYAQLSNMDGVFRMDANITLTKKEAGDYRETGYLSLGNQDLVAICLRLALIHAMYQNEKPFIIIDDAFVNLDNAKVKMARQFLNSIAKDYQVIYFTCHDSRA